MGDLFFKSLKWCFFVTFIIGGLAGFDLARTQGIQPMMPAILSIGCAYIMAGPWRKLAPKPMILSILCVAFLAFLAAWLPRNLYVYGGVALPDINYYVFWAMLVFLLGLPFMAWVFKKYD